MHLESLLYVVTSNSKLLMGDATETGRRVSVALGRLDDLFVHLHRRLSSLELCPSTGLCGFTLADIWVGQKRSKSMPRGHSYIM